MFGKKFVDAISINGDCKVTKAYNKRGYIQCLIFHVRWLNENE